MGAVCALVLVTLLSAVGCGRREVTLTGRTMGTSYHIKVIAGAMLAPARLQRRIDACLEAVNRSMSTYDPDSELSRFNRLPAEVPMTVSADLAAVLAVARRIHVLSEGAWDGTVGPLVALWGFSGDAAVRQVPSPSQIAAARQHVGFGRIRFIDERTIVKTDGALVLDLASIAKGFGVDRVADLIAAAGFTDYLVEIGGEVLAAGHRLDGQPWQVGINRPDPKAAAQEVLAAVALQDRALATSGDYRNYFEVDGVRYGHVLDPRTGFPVANGVVSVSIMAPSCTLADGLATAIMVMGAETGLALVERLDDVEAFIIVHHPDDTWSRHPSSGFRVEEV